MYDLLFFAVFVMGLYLWYRESNRHDEANTKIASDAAIEMTKQAEEASEKKKADNEPLQEQDDDQWWEAYEMANTREPFEKFVRFNKKRGRTAADVLVAMER